MAKPRGSSSDERPTENSGGKTKCKGHIGRGTCDRGNSSPPEFFDESMIDEQTGTTIRRSQRATKNQGPKSFGSPVKHSVKEINTNEDIADLNELALEKYRYKLANLKTDTSKPLETRLNLLERHLFRRKFRY